MAHARTVHLPPGALLIWWTMCVSSQVINAELLSLPGASLAVGSGPPARIEINVPLGQTGRTGHFYFCFRCHEAMDLTPTSNRTAGCLFGRHRYEAPHLRQAVRRRHFCRHFDRPLMHALCASFSRAGDRSDHRGGTYAEQYFPWWCRGLPTLQEDV